MVLFNKEGVFMKIVILLLLFSLSCFAENFVIEGTPKTPTISFDLSNGILEIKGRSIPENSIEFYKPVHDVLINYLERPDSYTLVNIYLDKINEESVKEVFSLFKKLESIHKGGSAVVINWHYEEDDEDMYLKGETFKKEIITLFKNISVNPIRWKMINIPIRSEIK